MKFDPKIYKKAAENIFNKQDFWSCWALNKIENNSSSENGKYWKKYAEYFQPSNVDIKKYKIEKGGWFGRHDSKEAWSNRLLALLLMAEIIRSEK